MSGILFLVLLDSMCDWANEITPSSCCGGLARGLPLHRGMVSGCKITNILGNGKEKWGKFGGNGKKLIFSRRTMDVIHLSWIIHGTASRCYAKPHKTKQNQIKPILNCFFLFFFVFFCFAGDRKAVWIIQVIGIGYYASYMRVPIYINARDSGFHNTLAIIYSLANFDMTEQLFSFTHWLPMKWLGKL